MAGEFAWRDVLAPLLRREDLPEAVARTAADEIMAGRATPAQMGAFLAALRAKGETAEEMAGMARSLLDHALVVDVEGPVVDTCGTGGDGSGTFNISTVAALVAAGAGARVAKHGNRSASSKCGSADVLEALGVAIDLPPDAARRCLDDCGITFLYARTYHPAMRHVAPVRSELGVPTVFNILGPLCNPARATRRAHGVADPTLARRMVDVLARLGVEFGFLFYGEDGLDELTPCGTSYIYRLRDGEVTHAEFTPSYWGITLADRADLQGGDVEENARIALAVLDGERRDGARSAVLMNASAAIVAAGIADGFSAGIEAAAHSIDSGAARQRLDRLAARSTELAGE